MATSALLLSTSPRWIGTARVPERLAKAGFAVSLLTPKNTLAEKSRFVGKVGHLPAEATTMEWVQAFAGMVAAVAPRIVIACDDTAQRLLQTLVLSPPPGMRPDVHLQLAQLVKESLGDPAHYRTTTDKKLLVGGSAVMGRIAQRLLHELGELQVHVWPHAGRRTEDQGLQQPLGRIVAGDDDPRRHRRDHPGKRLDPLHRRRLSR